MKIAVFGLLLAATLLVGAQAQAGFGGGLGAWWMDGFDVPALGSGACATCTGVQGTGFQAMGAQGAGFQSMGFANTGFQAMGAQGPGAGLVPGFGDGTLPQPLDGTGFGSPWMR